MSDLAEAITSNGGQYATFERIYAVEKMPFTDNTKLVFISFSNGISECISADDLLNVIMSTLNSGLEIKHIQKFGDNW